jgi:hypothetical protein
MDIKSLSKAVITVAAIFALCFSFTFSLDYAVRHFSKQAVSNVLLFGLGSAMTAIYYQLYKANSK